MLSKLNPSATDFPRLRRKRLQTLQVNLGYLCNQSCTHCHVNAGPNRTEVMTSDTVDAVIDFLDESRVKRLDLTGGAPELNPYFRRLVIAARELNVEVIDRCNLTVLLESGQEDLAEFLAGQEVEIVASLPCYSEENVNSQRGKGVFHDSIIALRQLNRLGYGEANSGLQLNLMYNPTGPFLPPSQRTLEVEYRQHLDDQYGVHFNQLFTLVNMPIQRFGSTLVSKGEFEDYMTLLRGNFSSENLSKVMCRELISVDWQGLIYDCDFNQMLGLPLLIDGNKRPHIRDIRPVNLKDQPIGVADHCYGCTAGSGSSCGGELTY
ncbi:MAG: radical SAM/Cys-rich domain protein [Proteobacteria bacterium]|jgi:radical SAM/Cys-rich protein|nr:radical SAM/Cys-rich domain protein [Pseudomonadota bacterium]MBT4107453.1 radical SAM/Cys-rich domain protein [Pseudomonadota bacterium]MBT4357960.1 radical SAM/Cys-rich domain protein [Pseudomonadota bacterium]MBT4988728.1 radical SAM/Cys-rich domain protein [Pseudomonadota bacterium]MBT5188495.1 radical SAM/Cys-rich domain protein [Pseudomonadota bacterium]